MYLIKAEIAIIAFLVFVAALAVKVSHGWAYGLPLLLVFIAIVVLFRHPKRTTPSSPLAVVAPIDAVVETVFSAQDPFLKQDCVVVRMRRRHLGVMGLYSPAQGRIQQAWYGEKYQRIAADETKDIGHIYTTWIHTDDKDDVLVSFYRARTLRYLQIRPQPGERIGQGRIMGLSSIRYIDIMLPKDVKLKVQSGDSLKAGEGVIGHFIHHSKKKKNGRL